MTTIRSEKAQVLYQEQRDVSAAYVNGSLERTEYRRRIVAIHSGLSDLYGDGACTCLACRESREGRVNF